MMTNPVDHTFDLWGNGAGNGEGDERSAGFDLHHAAAQIVSCHQISNADIGKHHCLHRSSANILQTCAASGNETVVTKLRKGCQKDRHSTRRGLAG